MANPEQQRQRLRTLKARATPGSVGIVLFALLMGLSGLSGLVPVLNRQPWRIIETVIGIALAFSIFALMVISGITRHRRRNETTDNPSASD